MDDKETLRENLKIIYRALPEQVKVAIFSPETTDAYDRIKTRYLLNDEQRETLSIQSGLLMMGLRLPQEFVAALMEELHLPREKASLIAQELNRDIFNAIKDDLKRIHQPEQSAAVTSSAPISTPPVPVTPPKPAEPLYPSFLQQIKESTPPYVSSTFPNAAPVISTPPIPIATQPVVPLHAATPSILPLTQPLPTQIVTPTPIVPTQTPVSSPTPTPMIPVTTVPSPAKSLAEIQASIQNPTAPQAIQTSFQGKAVEMEPSNLPTTGAPFMQREIVLNPTGTVPPVPQETLAQKPLQVIPVQSATPFVAAPVIPVVPLQPVSTPVLQAPAQRVVSQTPPPPASIFEQKMSGAFTIKSDVPDYSTPMPAPVAPEPQAPATFQMPQPVNPAPSAPTGDAYREPIG